LKYLRNPETNQLTNGGPRPFVSGLLSNLM
jgi:hypothetical protein